MVRLLLIRHCQSTWNSQGRIQGQQDPPLSIEGLAQAQALAERLRGVLLPASTAATWPAATKPPKQSPLRMKCPP